MGRVKVRPTSISVPGSFRFVDLFSGIGGFHLAMSRMGGRCVLASEIDPACRSVYAEYFGIEPVGDIRSVTKDARSIPEHDVLCAGFPCQPFSKSGQQLGVRDKTRGTLFFEIMEVIRARHPAYVILENVRNLAGPKHLDTWRTIVESLRQEGYDVSDEPAILSPHLLPPPLGAPQVRERVFVLARHAGPGRTAALSGGPLVTNRPPDGWHPSNWSVEDILDADERIPNLARYQLRAEEIGWLDAWQDFLTSVDDLPSFPIWEKHLVSAPSIEASDPPWKVDFLRKNSEFFRRNTAAIEGWRRRHPIESFPASRRKLEWQARGHDRDIWKLVIHLRPSGIRAKPPTYLPALVAITQTSIIGARRRRITPREASRLQGFPEDFPLPLNDSVAYRQLGNAVNVGVAEFVARQLFESSPGSQLSLAS